MGPFDEKTNSKRNKVKAACTLETMGDIDQGGNAKSEKTI